MSRGPYVPGKHGAPSAIGVIDLSAPSPVALMSEKLHSAQSLSGKAALRSSDFLKGAASSASMRRLSFVYTEDNGSSTQSFEPIRVSKPDTGMHVMDITRKIDGAVKELSKIGTGVAFVSADPKPDTGLMLMEYEEGSVSDYKRLMSDMSGSLGEGFSPGSLMRRHLPIIFIGKNIKTRGAGCEGWGCIAYADANGSSAESEIGLSLVAAKTSAFEVRHNDDGSPSEPGPWVADITAQVEREVASSGMVDGTVLVSTPHTTVGIMASERGDGLEKLKSFLMRLAPEGADYVHHRTAGDHNGHGHLMAELVGSYALIALSGGKLDLGSRRVLLMDCDPEIGKSRAVGTAVMPQSSETPWTDA